MGRYVYGNEGFSYKYVFAAQPTNLRDLEGWAGVGRNKTMSTFKTQLYLAHDDAHEESMALIDGAGHVTCVYESVIAPADIGVDLSSDFESAIYQIADDWKRIVTAIDESLPGTAFNPDLCLAHSYSFTRDDWAPLCAKIGHGADPTDRPSLEAARDAVFESAEGGYLPLLAANALLHAIEHDIDSFELVDGDDGQTNLWSVVDETAGPYDEAAPFEDRAARARVLSFQWERKDEAIERLEQLVSERPTALYTIQALFARYIWDDAWDKIGEVAGRALDADQTDATRGALLRWRGEAQWIAGDMDSARVDAEAAAALGCPELLVGLNAAD